MHPGIAGFYAIFTNVFRGMKDADLIEMGTVWFPAHEFLLSQTSPQMRDPVLGHLGARIRDNRNHTELNPKRKPVLVPWIAG